MGILNTLSIQVERQVSETNRKPGVARVRTMPTSRHKAKEHRRKRQRKGHRSKQRLKDILGKDDIKQNERMQFSCWMELKTKGPGATNIG